jgi:hypothetical protein
LVDRPEAGSADLPSKRIRRARHEQPQITPLQLAYLIDAPLPPESEWSTADQWWWTTQRNADWHENLAWYEQSAAALWRDLGDQLLPAFVQRHPGRRPRCWWDYEAPRQPLGTWPGWWLDGKLSQPRERVGGTGDPDFEHLAVLPHYEYGMPATWLDDYWSDRLRRDRPGFTGRAYHPGDPPTFESQAAYLARHGLFLPGERRRLRKADFEPEAVLPAPLDDDEREDLIASSHSGPRDADCDREEPGTS